MKKNTKRVIAIVLSAVLILALAIHSSESSRLKNLGQKEQNQTSSNKTNNEEQNNNGEVAFVDGDASNRNQGDKIQNLACLGEDAPCEVSYDQKEKESFLDEILENGEREIDYPAIVEEISKESYRESVEVEDNTVVIVRKEKSGTKKIEEEKWYTDIDAKSNEIISVYEETNENGESEKVVTYRIETGVEDAWSTVDYANGLEGIEIAEPEYIFYISAEGVPSEEKNEGMAKQWYLNDLQTKNVWSNQETYQTATGEGVVVAVVDTGVDYNHEDLANNMWMNVAELGGQEGVDDDGNGYVDDIYGINLIDAKRGPMDDHGHGTHVAGIIAMENNEVGGVGIAYQSKIMSIKAAGSDGTLNSSDIARAINYAYKNGADVINMSFGSYAHSAVVEGALQDAFGSSVLVAAAGNDSYPTLDSHMNPSGNMYPAAYAYVVGVMAYDSSNSLASFSNWDFEPNYGAEYEIVAPGANIYSTLPNGRYASWNGTSMATPMASAVAAVLRSSLPDKNTYSSRYIMGQITSATEESISYRSPLGRIYTYSKLSLVDSLTKKAKPNINIDEVYVFDAPDIDPKNNGDGIIQPGEVLDIAVGLRNQWGAATDVNLTVNSTSSGEVENPYVTFLTGKELPIEDVGTFGTQNNGFTYNENGKIIGVKNPIRVKISEDAPNDLNVQFNINYHAKNALDDKDTTLYVQERDTRYVLSVVRGTILEGKISSDLTLKSNEYYIVKNSLLIPKGVTVNVEPGTKIQFWAADQADAYGDQNMAYISVKGNLYFNGTEAAPIELFPGKDYEMHRVQIEEDGGTVTMNYVNILNPYIYISYADHITCMQDYDYILYRMMDSNGDMQSYMGNARVAVGQMSNSKISNLRGNYVWDRAEVSGKFDTVLFDNCQVAYNTIEAVNCTFLNNQGRVEDVYTGTLQYFTSQMNNVGNSYKNPEYETYPNIYSSNGKKYALYDFSQFFFENSWIYDRNGYGTYISAGYDNFKALEKALERNGGRIAALNPEKEETKQLLRDIYHDYSVKNETTASMYITAGYYYNAEDQRIETTSGNSTPTYFLSGMSKSSPLSYYYAFMSSYVDGETGDTVEQVEAWISSGTTDMQRLVLVEYGQDVDDYTVRNPLIDIRSLDLMESTKFTKNAILNRLIDKDISNWMKVAANENNSLINMITGNYWGTTDPTLVQKQIMDFDTNIRYGDYITDPILSEPAESAYPCVSKVYFTDKNGDVTSTVGNGTYDVHVVFNRDMDTTKNPMVSYGPDDPYTDYVVSGEWKSKREWVGQTTVKILINQGQQYIRVKDAVAASDSWLSTGTDWARFGFTIQATGAEALTLQAEGVKGAVYLNWTQDEYDTMAGFNVYRSESGQADSYRKVNSSVVSSDEREFTDNKVMSGKKYYYYFTVVDTDMTESRPSNIVICASLDDEVPVINHTPAKSLTYGINAAITANITDNVGVNSAWVYYRMEGEENYRQVYMTNTSGNTFGAQILAKDLSVGTLQYYIVAADSVDCGYNGSAEKPYSVPVESNAVITSVDAEDVEVGSTISGILKGINFAEDYKVQIDGKTLQTEFVSDTEIHFTYTPESMGIKRVDLVQDKNVLAFYPNAVVVKDSTIRVWNENSTIVKEKDSWQNIYLYSNYVGKVSELEITYEGSYNNTYLYPVQSYSSGSTVDNGDGTMTAIFRMSGNSMSERLFYWQVYQYTENALPTVVSVKINGVQVENVAYDANKVNLIDKNAYIPVEDIVVEQEVYALDVGQTFEINAYATPNSASLAQNMVYSYDTSVIRKNADGTFTALKSGGHYINIENDGISKTVYVNVAPIPVTSIMPEQDYYKGAQGSVITVRFTTDPEESDSYLQCYSDNSELAEVINNADNGRTVSVKLKAPGTVKLNAYDSNGASVRGSTTIEIIKNEAYVEIDQDIVAMYPNQISDLSAQIKNAGSSNASDLVWTTSNSAVAIVDNNGHVQSVGNGYAMITARVNGNDNSDSVIILVGSDSMTYTLGDANMDGKVSSIDAMFVLKLAMLDSVNEAVQKVADVNADGKVSAADAMLILQYVTGVIKEF